MGAVRLFMSMSLDGFVADRTRDSTALYPDLGDQRNNEALAEMIESTGAVVMGRRSYDMGDTDEGYVDYEHQVPIFVLTNRVPEVPARHDPAKGLTFTFVTEGVESAVEQAKAAAGGKDVQVIGGADIARQLIRAGLPGTASCADAARAAGRMEDALPLARPGGRPVRQKTLCTRGGAS